MTNLTKTIEELNNKKDLIVTIDSDDQHITITYKGLMYERAHHYIDYSSDQNAETIHNTIVSGYEYEKKTVEQNSIILTNDNRF